MFYLVFAVAICQMLIASLRSDAFSPTITPNDLSLFVKESSNLTQSQVPVVSPVWIGKGQFKNDDLSLCLQLASSCKPLDAQVNVISHWDDGSLKQAMVAFKLDVTPGSLYEIKVLNQKGVLLTGSPTTNINPDLLKVSVELVNKAGETWKYEVKSGQPILDYVKNNNFVTLLDGSVVKEIKIKTPLKKSGAASGQFYLTMWWKVFDGGSAQVTARVVNGLVKSKVDSTLPFNPDDVELTSGFIEVGGSKMSLDGKTFYDQTQVAHTKKVGTSLPRLIVRQNPGYLSKFGILPWFFNYLEPVTTGQVDKKFKTQLASTKIDFLGSPLGKPFEPYPLASAMNQTGDRAEIGPITDFAAAAFNSLSTNAEDLLKVVGSNALSSFAVFAYDRDSDSFLIPYNDGRLKDLRSHRLKPPTSPDRAHSPNACELYVLLGEELNRDICETYGSYSYNRWPQSGIEQYYGSRDSAWSKRNGYFAYLTAPDGQVSQAYFKERMEVNFAHYAAQVLDPAKVLHTSGIGVFNPGGRERAVPMLIESPWQFAWHVSIGGFICRSMKLADACTEFRHLAQYFIDAVTKAVGTTWTAPDGTVHTWNTNDFKRIVDYSVPWGTYTPYLDKTGNIALTKGTDKPLQTYAEIKWWQKLYVDLSFNTKAEQPPFPLPDASPSNWRTKSGYTDLPLPSSSWIEYALHTLSVACVNDVLPGGDVLYNSVKPDIDKNVSEAGLRQIKY